MGFFNTMIGDDAYGRLLDDGARKQALMAGISGFGDAVLSQGYSRVPRGPLQGIGAGMQGFTRARDAALQHSLQTKLLTRSLDREDERDNRDRVRFDIDKRRADREDTEANRKDEAVSQISRLLNPALANAPTVSSEGTSGMPAMPQNLTGMPTVPDRAPRPQPDMRALLPHFAQAGMLRDMLPYVMPKSKEQNRYMSAGGGVIFDTDAGKPAYVKPIERDREDRELVPIYDESSPTKIRMVPRSQAAGQPGAPRGSQGGVTPTQQARNGDIQAARRQLDGMTREQIVSAAQQFTATGRNNPDYNPFVARAARIASRKLTGEDDPDHTQFWSRMIPNEGAGSGDQPASGGETSMLGPRGSYDLSRGGAQAGEAVPMKGGAIDRTQLKRDGIYSDGRGGAWRWTGMGFEAVE